MKKICKLFAGSVIEVKEIKFKLKIYVKKRQIKVFLPQPASVQESLGGVVLPHLLHLSMGYGYQFRPQKLS